MAVWKDFSTHFGHGLGLDIHEAPRLGQFSNGKLVAGQVVTVSRACIIRNSAASGWKMWRWSSRPERGI